MREWGGEGPPAALEANAQRIVFRRIEPSIFFRGFMLNPQFHQANPVVETFLQLVEKTMKHELAALGVEAG